MKISHWKLKDLENSEAKAWSTSPAAVLNSSTHCCLLNPWPINCFTTDSGNSDVEAGEALLEDAAPAPETKKKITILSSLLVLVS